MVIRSTSFSVFKCLETNKPVGFRRVVIEHAQTHRIANDNKRVQARAHGHVENFLGWNERYWSYSDRVFIHSHSGGSRPFNYSAKQVSQITPK